jgi:serine/threonine-protein kinase HipA
VRNDHTADFRLSIAGAQEKTALLWHKKRWNIPTGTTPTTHIFKLPLGLVGNGQLDMRTSVENEWMCSKLMQAYGLPTANCEVGQFEDQTVLIVERFDRRAIVNATKEHWIARLPQEDFCQATGTSYLKKYQADGGPGIDSILNLLRNSKHAQADRETFFKCQFVFWLLAAIDGHAKNFSIHVEAGGAYSLTPFYDVLSAYPVMGTKAGQLSPMKAKLAMGVRGEQNMHYRLGEIKLRHWLETAKRNGLSDIAESVIRTTIAATPTVIKAVRAQLPNRFPTHIRDSIFSGLIRASKEVAGQLK